MSLALIALASIGTIGRLASAADRETAVVMDDDGEPLYFNDNSVAPVTSPVESTSPKSTRRQKSIVPKRAPKAGPPTSRPAIAAVDTNDVGTEASANVPTGAGANTPCLHGCGEPVHEGPISLFEGLGRDLRHVFQSKTDRAAELLSLTGANMSCAQIDLLKGAKYNVARRYRNYNGSNGRCGPAVGDSIVTAGRLFSGGDRVEGTMADFSRTDRYGVKFAKLLPKNGFIRTAARSVIEAPEGSVLVFSGPCSPGYERSNCNPYSSSDGEKWGHVTIKGSPRMDRGKQWYYTDGRPDWAANRTRRYFIGAFLPPGSDRGACQAVYR